MKLFKLYFGQKVQINLKELDEETRNTLKRLYRAMNESLDLDNECLSMVAIRPSKKGYEVSPTKELGTMGHSIDAPRKAIIVPDSPSPKQTPIVDPDFPKPKGFGFSFDSEEKEDSTPAVASDEPVSHDSIAPPEKSPMEADDFDTQVFKQRIKNIIDKLDSWEGDKDDKKE